MLTFPAVLARVDTEPLASSVDLQQDCAGRSVNVNMPRQQIAEEVRRW